MDRLEVWARVKRSDGDYRMNFDCEMESTAALCAALAESDLVFKHDWNVLVLQLTNEYGSQWRWRNTLGYTKVRIDRETLIELRNRGLTPSEYPRYCHLFAYKVGPPDYVSYEWSPPHAENNPSQ
jgi:hypothetical protein